MHTLVLVACVAYASGSHPAKAEGETNAANVAAARRHYERARADYTQGAYREAVAELEAAHALDPNAKDLVFNLAVVREKLADIDEALKWFHLYATMDLTDDERERAEAYIRRLEGAKRELDEKARARAAPAPAPEPASSQAAPAPKEAPPQHEAPAGRIDAATLGAAGLAGVAFLVGVTLGVKAELDRPSSTFVTGRDGSYQNLVDRAEGAHREAVFADVGFAVSIAAASAAVILYFARPRGNGSLVGRGPRVLAAPAVGGATLWMQGTL
jgi:tetratricopeptide (TPR) repeat protein